MALRNETFGSTYPDTAYFSDQVLLPQLARGANITVVSGFLSSYVIRLVSDAAKSPEIEPGLIDLTFCIPGGNRTGESDSKQLARYFSAFNDANDVEEFVIQALKLSDEGGLRFSCLIADAGSNLTRASIGLIHEPGDLNNYVSFLDEQGGDSNSPIKIARSWAGESERNASERLEDLINAATNDSWDRIRRLGNSESAALLRQIAVGSLLEDVSQEKPEPKVKPAKVVIPYVEEDDDAADFEDDIDELNAEFDELSSFLDNFSDDAEEMINIYFTGGRIPRRWEFDEPTGLKPVEHALPFPESHVAMLSEYEGVCKCGESYDRRFGCSG